MGKSEYAITGFEVLMCSERYADDIPLRLPNTQLPPTRSDFSKQSYGSPRSRRALAAAMPEEPAPMMHESGRPGDVMGAVAALPRDTGRAARTPTSATARGTRVRAPPRTGRQSRRSG